MYKFLGDSSRMSAGYLAQPTILWCGFNLYSIEKYNNLLNVNHTDCINISIVDNREMDKEYLQKFAINLKRIRKEKGIKQDDFMGIDGISRSTISMVETSRTDITLSKLKIIAKVLNVHPKELLDFDL